MIVIAELGSNWKTLDDCKNAISLAKSIGADAIKYQLCSHEELYGYYGQMPGQMPREWIPELAEKAKATGIDFMCTAFSVEGLRVIEPYVQTHKLASSEMCHVNMLGYLKNTGKPVLISTGGQTEVDTRAVAKAMGPQATFLYCEASYPARMVDFRKMQILLALVKAYGGTGIGYSDHSTDVYTHPVAAKRCGAVVLEKHFNPFDYKDTPDAGHALNVQDFRSMVRALNGTDSVNFTPTADEEPMQLIHKRRLVMIRAAEVGEVLVYGANYGVFRAKSPDVYAAHPALAHEAKGKMLKLPKKVGDPLGPNDYE